MQRYRQTANVIALDRQDEKLQLAQTVGADFTVNTSKYHIHKDLSLS